jgi:RNA polymerase sigma factor (sigma-70 family)
MKEVGTLSSLDFNQLYVAHSKHLYYIAYRYTKDRYLAEDIVQETFIKAYKNRNSVEEPNKLKAWLSVITTRTAIDFLRSEKRKSFIPVEPASMEPMFGPCPVEVSTEEAVEIRLFHEEFSRSMGDLSLEFQEVLILKVQYGLKETEIASLLDLKSGTVKTRLYRARKQLKQNWVSGTVRGQKAVLCV